MVWNDLVENPIELRYAWARNPLGNLVNDAERIIPVPLFRTDHWDYPEAPYLNGEYEEYRKKQKILQQHDDSTVDMFPLALDGAVVLASDFIANRNTGLSRSLREKLDNIESTKWNEVQKNFIRRNNDFYNNKCTVYGLYALGELFR